MGISSKFRGRVKRVEGVQGREESRKGEGSGGDRKEGRREGGEEERREGKSRRDSRGERGEGGGDGEGFRGGRILRRSTWKHRVLHGTCIQHGRNIKTLCIGSASNLLNERIEVLSNTIEHYHSSRNTLPAYCSPQCCLDGNWRSQKRESAKISFKT